MVNYSQFQCNHFLDITATTEFDPGYILPFVMSPEIKAMLRVCQGNPKTTF